MDENDIITLAREGNKAAMEQLLKQYHPLLVSLSRRIAGTGAAFEDLLQAGSIGLICAARHYDAEREVRLITYAVPWILGEMKRAAKKAAIYEESLSDAIEWRCKQRGESLTCAVGKDLELFDLRLAIGKLLDNERKVILLRYFRDYTQNETAKILSKSQTQISRLESRAIDKLRGWLTLSENRHQDE